MVYGDHGDIKAKLSVVIQDLADLKRVLKDDHGLQFNIDKTTVLPKGVSHRTVFDVAHGIINPDRVTSVGMLFSSLSVLKVSLVLQVCVCLFVLMLLYATL